MQRTHSVRAVLTSVTTALAVPGIIMAQTTTTSPKPPIAPKQSHVSTIHGYSRSDDYFWLRERDNPAVRAYLDAENAYTAAQMQPTEALQKTLYEEMIGRIKQTDQSVPYRKGEWEYYTRTIEGKQYPIYARRRVGSTVEEITLDQNELAANHKFYSIAAYSVSDDGNSLAYTVDTTGYRQYTLHVKDLRTGKTFADAIPRVGSVVWARDNKTLFFTTEDSVTKRSNQFWRHTVGTTDKSLVYDEKDELYDLGASRSLDRAMIILTSYSKTIIETHALPADQPSAALRLIVPRSAGHESYVDYDAGKFYIRTNAGAKNFSLVSAPAATPDESHWTELVPANPAVKLEDVSLFAHHMVLSERENGLEYLRVIDKGTGASRRVDTPDSVYTMALGNNHEYDVATIQFDYNSLVTPQSTFAYDMRTGARTLLKRQEVYHYDPANYESHRV